MKKLKVSLSAMALLLGIGAAFAGSSHQTLEKKWGINRSNGQFVDVTGEEVGTGYSCTGANAVCTETYPADVNPNDQANDAHPGVAQASSMEAGIFAN